MARYRFDFWLDGDKDNELLLMEDIDALKRLRLFSSTIRDGIRLMMDLRRGSFDVLIELFPDIRHHIVEPGQGDNGGGNGDDIKAIRQQLARLEQATLQQSAPGGLLMAAHASGPKPMTIPALKAPVFDDDDDGLLRISRDTSTASADNFLKAAFALQG
jgi:hypothetical protein